MEVQDVKVTNELSVRVVDLDIDFGTLIGLLIKLVLAAIPALGILAVAGFFLAMLLMAVLNASHFF